MRRFEAGSNWNFRAFVYTYSGSHLVKVEPFVISAIACQIVHFGFILVSTCTLSAHRQFDEKHMNVNVRIQYRVMKTVSVAYIGALLFSKQIYKFAQRQSNLHAEVRRAR